MDYSLEQARNRVADARIKPVLDEVLTSYNNKCYRSATVMLWSVVVLDIRLKLESLSDIYEDSSAKKILAWLEKIETDKPRFSAWEADLLKKVAEQTQLLSSAEHQQIAFLQQQRHLCAHPVFDPINELFEPNRDQVRANIRLALDAVLTKPPVLSQKVISALVTDLAANKDALANDEALEKYLRGRYFSRLSDPVRTKVFRDLWKFVFRLTDPLSEENRDINYRALCFLYGEFAFILEPSITASPDHFGNVTLSDTCIDALIGFNRKFPAVFSHLPDSIRAPISAKCKETSDGIAKAVFLSDSIEEHINMLGSKSIEIGYEGFEYLERLATGEERQQLVVLVINRFKSARSYNEADALFQRMVQPLISEMTHVNIKELLENSVSNSQIIDRGMAVLDHRKILERMKELGIQGLASEYPRFFAGIDIAE